MPDAEVMSSQQTESKQAPLSVYPGLSLVQVQVIVCTE